MLAGQQLQPAVLGVVGVLVLVDQHVTEAVRVPVPDLGEQLQHVDGADQQVVEVHRVGAMQLTLVGAIHVGDGLLEVGADQLGVGVRVAQLVLGVGDLRADRGGREPLGVDPKVIDAALDQPPRVGRVVDRELSRVAEPRRLGAQHPRAGGVERHHPHRADAPADQQLGTVAHLAGGLVRERDRQDLVRLRRVGPDQVGDPVRQHPGLARARARDDQQRPLSVGHGLALGLVEPLQQDVEVSGQLSHRLVRPR